MTVRHTISHLRRWIYEMMNAPYKFDATAKIDQSLRVDDKVLKRYEENDKNVYIVQAAQINIQQSITEIGTKALEVLDALDDGVEIYGDIHHVLAYHLRNGVSLQEFMTKIKSAYVSMAMAGSQSVAESARKLGMGRTTLVEYLKRRNLLDENFNILDDG